MEHLIEPIIGGDASPVVLSDWLNRVSHESRGVVPKIEFKKTRSTLAVNASDLATATTNQAADTFVHMMKLCKTSGRAEIVIDCIEVLSDFDADDNLPINKCQNLLESYLTLASRKMNEFPARIALEKRGSHFDLRVYLTRH